MRTKMKNRYNFTLEKKYFHRLEALAKKHKRSKSNMIEILIDNAWENKCDVSHTIIKNKIDELEKD